MNLVRRARPLLGTMVSVVIEPDEADASPDAIQACCAGALDRVALIGALMSAHSDTSDLARLACAGEGEVVRVNPHTLRVFEAARAWCARSAQAFDPLRAGDALYRAGQRPGLKGRAGAVFGGFEDAEVLEDGLICLRRPLRLDLGGIAKGYAVDQAVEFLVARGLPSVLVNAGGDMRAHGPRRWPVEVRHAGRRLNDRQGSGPRVLHHAALATSAGAPHNESHVGTGRRQARMSGSGGAHGTHGASPEVWRSATVRAADCLSADALTKWALHSGPGAPRLARALREKRAAMWGSE